MPDLLRSPLHDRHVALGAKLADFGGWEMPIEYTASGGGGLKEHAAGREEVGLLLDEHPCKDPVSGPGGREVVYRCPTYNLGRIAPGPAEDTLCCQHPG